MKRAMRMIIILTLVAFAGTSLAFAKGKKCPGYQMEAMHGKDYDKKEKGMDLKDKFFKKIHMIFAYEDKLDLSDDQKDKIINEKFALKKTLIEKGAQIDVILLDLKKEFMKDELDTRAINAKIDQKYDLKKEKAKALVAAYNTVKKTLSDKQYQTLKDIWSDKMMKKMRGKEEMMHKKEKMRGMEGHMRGMH